MESTDTSKKKRKKRRRRGTGQVIPRGGDTFLVRVFLRRDEAGKRIFHSETVRGTEADADNRCDDIRTQIRHGTFIKPLPVSLADFFKEWLSQKKREGVRESTLQGYKDIVDIYVLPHLGAASPLALVKPRDVLNLYNTLQDSGLSVSTIKHARSVLKMAFNYALTLQYIAQHPATGIKIPLQESDDTEAPKGRAMDEDEAIKLLKAARENPDDLIFIFALCTGLRPEEYIGLQRPYLNLVTQLDKPSGRAVERGIVQVRRTIVRRRGGGWYFSKPKTKKGRRDVYFPASLYYDLLEHLSRQDEHKRRMGASYKDHDLVFASVNGEPLDRCNLYARRFKALLKRAEISADFTLYSLRYSYATLSLLAGEVDKVVSDQMGHSKVNFTKDVYVKVLPGMKQRASDRLENLLFSSSNTPLAHIEAQETM